MAAFAYSRSWMGAKNT